MSSLECLALLDGKKLNAVASELRMKVHFGPFETEVTVSASGMIAIDQRVAGDDSDRAYSSVMLSPANAQAISSEILRLIEMARSERM